MLLMVARKRKDETKMSRKSARNKQDKPEPYTALILRNQDGTVAYMECGAEFADALNYMLQAPLGSVIADMDYTDDEELSPPLYNLYNSICSLRPQIFLKAKEKSVPASLFKDSMDRPDEDELQIRCPFRSCQKENPHGSQYYQNHEYDEYDYEINNICDICGESQKVVADGSSGYCPFAGTCVPCQIKRNPGALALKQKSEQKTTFKETVKFLVTDRLRVYEMSSTISFELIARCTANQDLRKVKSEKVFITPSVMKEMIGRAFLNSENILSETFAK